MTNLVVCGLLGAAAMFFYLLGYRTGLNQGKRIIQMLLDEKPSPTELAEEELANDPVWQRRQTLLAEPHISRSTIPPVRGEFGLN